MGGYTGYSGSISNPGLDTILASWWGAGYESSSLCGIVGSASNIVSTAGNPQYTINDFLAMYPNFAGPPSSFTATVTDQSPVLLNVTPTGTGNYGTPTSGAGGSGLIGAVGLGYGQLVTGPGITANSTIQSWGGGYGVGPFGGGGYGIGSLILSNPAAVNPPNQLVGIVATTNLSNVLTNIQDAATVYQGGPLIGGLLLQGPGIAPDTTIVEILDSTSALLSLPTTGAATNVQLYVSQPLQLAPLTIYEAPFVPLMVMQLYISLAVASLPQQLYFEYWKFACANFVAHFCQLFLDSAGQPASSAGQVAAQGMQSGILTSKSVGGVSAGYTNNIPPEFASMYGPIWSLSKYGNILQSLAATITPRFMYVP